MFPSMPSVFDSLGLTNAFVARPAKVRKAPPPKLSLPSVFVPEVYVPPFSSLLPFYTFYISPPLDSVDYADVELKSVDLTIDEDGDMLIILPSRHNYDIAISPDDHVCPPCSACSLPSDAAEQINTLSSVSSTGVVSTSASIARADSAVDTSDYFPSPSVLLLPQGFVFPPLCLFDPIPPPAHSIADCKLHCGHTLQDFRREATVNVRPKRFTSTG